MKNWFYILAKTVLPQGGIGDETPISSGMRHAITRLTHRMPFDFEDYFLRIIGEATEDQNA